ncbi:rod shape-determining protein MreD [Jeotgalibacillus proteolyticus]|uniref:Rod shape-determining protein MreD n=1 Tax=Jeotgalibacillus proteolyticus TaxID=2082395 RepID=A0A2S5GF56_9BACL|nr:rod shape-determining protein MreD [Jeotgalibacillus proteolyticus]PPA71544.1 rod shape-determining protein MreD [Jeotgalibacillus proteolyticus]
MTRFILPLLGIFIFYSESIFATFSPVQAYGDTRFLVPRFLFLFILLISIYYKPRTAYIFGFVFGFMYDLFFTGIIGIYMFLFPLLIYIALAVLKLIHQHLIVIGLLGIVLIAGLEWVVYQFNLLIGVAGVDFSTFLTQRLYSTLLFNSLFLLLLAYPLKVWMINLRQTHYQE